MDLLCPHCRAAVKSPEESGGGEMLCPACGSGIRLASGETGTWAAPQEPEEIVSHYRLVRRIGRGGMGVVYEAQDTRLGRGVALKFLPPDHSADRPALQRFQREARAASALNHPNICTLHDIGRHDDRPFLVLELLEGQTLRQRIQGRPLAVEELLDLGLQVCDALEAAHARGIIHRDLKPANLFLTSRGPVKVLDFGLAKLVGPQPPEAAGDDGPLSNPGSVIGTVAYMSPEQARGQDLDARGDLFSFGVVLYEAATGRPPFQGDTTALLFDAILNRAPEPPRRCNPALPAELERIILKALEKDRAARYQTAADLRADLKHLKRDSESGKTTVAVPAAKRGRRVWWFAAAGAGVIAALLLIGLFSGLIRLPFGKGVPVPSADRGTAAEPPSPEPLGPPRVTPFLAGDAVRKQPAWSPAGNLIAYVSDEAGNDDIWICDPAGANPINLTASYKGVDQFPAWSPGGQRIAFYSDRDGGGIYTMSVLGGDVHKVVALKPSVLYTFSLTWAKNGQIVYTNFNGDGDKVLYGVSETDRTPKCLTDLVAAPYGQCGEISPSGDLLAFLDPFLGSAPLLLGDFRSRRFVQLEQSATFVRWGGPERLYFISSRDGLPDLWALDVDPRTGSRAGASRRLTSGLNLAEFTASPDGRKVLAVKTKSQRRLWSFPPGAGPYSTLAAGKPLTNEGFTDGEPMWTPDGKELLFISNRRGPAEVWKLAPGGAPVRLTTGGGDKVYPEASPDGRWIAFSATSDQGVHTVVMRPDGSDAHSLIPENLGRSSVDGAYDWSPDGGRVLVLIVSKEQPWATLLAAFDRDTGTIRDPVTLQLPGKMPEAFSWSPDGRFLVYEAFSDGSWDLWVADSEGKNPRRLTSDPGNERGARWSPDGKFIYYVKDFRSVWRLPVDADARPTGPAERWAEFPKTRIGTHALALGRDGFVIAVTEEASDLWLVEFPEK